MKRCTRCREEKPLSDFPSDKSRKDGLANKCRPCCYEQWKSWRERNLEHSKTYQRNYRSANPEKVKEWAGRHKKPDPSKAAEWTRKWAAKNVERVRAKQAEYREVTKQRRADYSRRRRLANPEYDRQNAARYKARKRGNTVEKVDYKAIAERDGDVCHLCASPIDPNAGKFAPLSRTFDHVIPLSRGGPHSMANVKVAHWVCNTRKNNRLVIPPL
jgi:5-methylcytosine-specific restriction endonuclease McrA